MGEKISTQHILKRVDASTVDKEAVFLFADSLYMIFDQNPFLFDSMAVISSNKYNNYSGVYNKPLLDIPDLLLEQLKLLGPEGLSKPYLYGDGYLLIYLYENKKEYLPNLISDWNLIYNLSKQQKQNLIFNNYIKNIKNDTYINIYYNN